MKKTAVRKPNTHPWKGKVITAAIIAVVLFGLLMALNIYIDREKRVFKECSVEAGTPIQASDFVRFKKDKSAVAFVYGTSHYDVTVPGEYDIELQIGKRKYHSKLIVTDSTAPVLSAVPKSTMYSVPLDPEEFIVTMNDQTQVSVEFAKEPDFQLVGTQDITLRCKDAGGNVTEATTQLVVIGIYPEITREAGAPKPKATDFAFGQENAALLTPLSDIKMDQPGDYTISFSVDGIRYDSVLHLRDTIAPTARGIKYEGFAKYPKNPEELIDGLADATEVTVEFVDDPHFDQPGERDIQIRLTDTSGNQEVVTTHVHLAEDTEAPVISGTHDISIITNEAIAYKEDVVVTDNADPNVTFTVDNSQVDTTTEGVYEATYKATDGAGNTTEVKVKVTVVFRPYTEDDLWALCDEVLKQIIRDDMTEVQKVEAIFNWVDWSIKYKGHAEKISWVQGAYDGLKNREGDCFNIACICHALYTRAGFETFIIERYPLTYAQHFWNAVKINGTWYHCDALTKEDGTRFFMWNSAQMKEYADAHRGYFYYDASKYPVEIP